MNNLTAVVDRNNIQIDGFTENVMPLESLKAKYEAFNGMYLRLMGTICGTWWTRYPKPRQSMKSRP